MMQKRASKSRLKTMESRETFGKAVSEPDKGVRNRKLGLSNKSIKLEQEAMRLLLDGDDDTLALLREQMKHVVTIRREYTGGGSYAHFTFDSNCPRLPGNASFSFGDVVCEVDGVDGGGGFVLFVNDGVLDFLETYSFDSFWPEAIDGYAVQYHENDGRRDIEALRRSRGWPRRGE